MKRSKKRRLVREERERRLQSYSKWLDGVIAQIERIQAQLAASITAMARASKEAGHEAE